MPARKYMKKYFFNLAIKKVKLGQDFKIVTNLKKKFSPSLARNSIPNN